MHMHMHALHFFELSNQIKPTIVSKKGLGFTYHHLRGFDTMDISLALKLAMHHVNGCDACCWTPGVEVVQQVASIAWMACV